MTKQEIREIIQCCKDEKVLECMWELYDAKVQEEKQVVYPAIFPVYPRWNGWWYRTTGTGKLDVGTEV